MQIHVLVERSSTFIRVFRAQSISHAGHFLLYKINHFLQQWRHDRKPTFNILFTEVIAFCFSFEHEIFLKNMFFMLKKFIYLA